MKKKKKILQGIPASKGVVIGKARLYKSEDILLEIGSEGSVNKRKETLKFERAKSLVINELEGILEHFRGSYRHIIESEILILNDPVLNEEVRRKIELGFSAKQAFIQSVKFYLQRLKDSEELIFKEKAREITHITRKVINVLEGKPGLIKIEPNSIVVARDLSPIDIFSISEVENAGIIAEQGGPTSHSVIVARSLNIPMVCGIKNALEIFKDGDEVILDGWSGKVFISPSSEIKEEYERKPLLYSEAIERLKKGPRRRGPKDRKRITIMGNALGVEDVEQVVKNNGMGIGLFRTELLTWDPAIWKNEESLAEIFEKSSKIVFPDPLIVRLVDIAGEPSIPGFSESSPFLGLRGIRFLLFEREIMKLMYRAILRASNLGNVRILLPMVTTLREVEESKKILERAKKELTREDIPYDTYIPLGIMIETPACALMAKTFAPYVDFISIGTNDLTQYTLAVDRTHPLLAPLYSEFHPSVLQLILHVVKSTHPYRKKVAVCGEMASDPLGAIVLMGIGVDELSVHPDAIPLLNSLIQWLEYRKVKEFVKKLFDIPDAKTIKTKVIEFVKKEIPPLAVFYE
jgi:phosphotransferase system enzyme I (PtsI)